MTDFNLYSLQLPDPDKCPARSLRYGFDSYVAAAATAADAAAFISGLSDSASWSNSNLVTPNLIGSGYTGTPNMDFWALRVRVYKSTDGSLLTDQTVYNNAASVNEASAFATGTLTGTSTAFAVSDTVTIGTRTYTFRTTPAVDGDVKHGGTYAASFANLDHAINASGGAAGDYVSLAPDPNVSSAYTSGTTLTVTARVEGADANSIATTVGGGNTGDAAWGDTTLGSGAGETVNTMSSLAAQMVTALNAAGVGIAHAAWDNSTQTLTVAGTADALGTDTIEISVYPPPYQILSGQVSSADQLPDYDPAFEFGNFVDGVPVSGGYPIPGFVISIDDAGSSGDDLSAVLVDDTYPVPALVLAAKAQQT